MKNTLWTIIQTTAKTKNRTCDQDLSTYDFLPTQVTDTVVNGIFHEVCGIFLIGIEWSSGIFHIWIRGLVNGIFRHVERQRGK